MAEPITLALAVAPELAPALAGPQAAATAAAAARAVQETTGTADESAARQALARDPQMGVDLRARLAQIAAAADQARHEAERQQLAAWLQQRPPTASAAGPSRPGDQWGAPLVSLIVLATFGCVMWAAMTRVLPPGSETIVNLLLGTLAAMATSVVAYWVGSSAGSATKTDLLFRARAIPPDKG